MTNAVASKRCVRLGNATRAHVEHVAANLRPNDAIEVRAAGFGRAEIVGGWARSAIRRTVLIDGEPALVFGCCPSQQLPGFGVPWLLATARAEELRIFIARHSRAELAPICRRFRGLRNAVHAGNLDSIRWLTWLGFTVKTEPVGPGGAFRHFEMDTTR